jgi:hypothetical protein
LVCGEQNVEALQLARPPPLLHALCKVDLREQQCDIHVDTLADQLLDGGDAPDTLPRLL